MLPVEPVSPVAPVAPDAPVAPGAPAGPGTATTVGGGGAAAGVTTTSRWHATKVKAAMAIVRVIAYFMSNLLSGENRSLLQGSARNAVHLRKVGERGDSLGTVAHIGATAGSIGGFGLQV